MGVFVKYIGNKPGITLSMHWLKREYTFSPLCLVEDNDAQRIIAENPRSFILELEPEMKDVENAIPITRKTSRQKRISNVV